MKSKIGKVRFENNLVLAPMAGVSDIAYRILCLNNGAGLVCSGMININALCRRNKATERIAQTNKLDSPVSLQLFGTKLDVIKNAVKLIEDQCDIIDFNFGCPDAIIIRQGAGSALLKRPKKIGDIVKTIRSATNNPITFKIRSGTKKQNLDATIKIAMIIEDNGADAIVVHPRTAAMGYRGKSDWEIIKAVKENLSIPVIGNGDIKSEEDAKRMLHETNCDFLMIGRASFGDPFIFNRINNYLKTGRKSPLPDLNDRIRALKEYIKLAEKYDLSKLTNLIQKTQMFIRGVKGTAKFRNKINRIKDKEELMKIINQI